MPKSNAHEDFLIPDNASLDQNESHLYKQTFCFGNKWITTCNRGLVIHQYQYLLD